MALRINLRNLGSSASGRKSLPDLLIGITADLEVNAERLSIYEEPDFPVVELAYHLRKWVDVKPDQRSDFILDSMESRELGLVRILRTDGGSATAAPGRTRDRCARSAGLMASCSSG